MTVHNHGIDPSCRERTVGDCLLRQDLVHLRLVATPEHTVKVLRVLLTGHDNFGRALIEPLIRQIEEQTQPPRIPEPSKYGVVKAAAAHHPHVEEWVNEGLFWRSLDGGASRDWDDLENPVLVREGV